jgi:hypothetical protein
MYKEKRKNMDYFYFYFSKILSDRVHTKFTFLFGFLLFSFFFFTYHQSQIKKSFIIKKYKGILK